MALWVTLFPIGHIILCNTEIIGLLEISIQYWLWIGYWIKQIRNLPWIYYLLSKNPLIGSNKNVENPQPFIWLADWLRLIINFELMTARYWTYEIWKYLAGARHEKVLTMKWISNVQNRNCLRRITHFIGQNVFSENPRDSFLFIQFLW